MRKSNIKGLQECGKARTALAEKKVLSALNTLRKSEEDITIAKISKESGVSPNFIYTHEDILNTIRKYTTPSGRKKKQTQDSKDTLINCLRVENNSLKRKIHELEKNENYRAKCEQLEQEIEKLKKELQEAYSLNLPLTY